MKVSVEDHDRQPVPNLPIFFDDHGLPESKRFLLPQAPICITASDGTCSGGVQYLYTVRHYRWQAAESTSRSGPRRFELWASPFGKRVSLGFLPQINQAHKSDFEVFALRAVLSARRPGSGEHD
jgi:hypothetical protein